MTSVGRVNRLRRTLRNVAAACVTIVAGATLMLSSVPPGFAASQAPTPAVNEPADAVRAILLDFNDGCNVDQAWSTLNADWAQYGSVPVSISTGGSLCSGRFTLDDLEASGADTVVVADTAWGHSWTASEIDALAAYIEEGHSLFGLGTDFQWHRHDDNALAPLFGLAEQSDGWLSVRAGGSGQPLYKLRLKNPVAPVLFRNVTNPYPSSTAGIWVQRPHDDVWSSNDLAGATFAGISKKGKSAITEYNGPGYCAVYIASSAWYYSTPDDLQFLYDALIYPREG